MRAGPAMGLAVDHGRIGELGEVNSSGEQDQEGRGARRVQCICPLAFAVVLSPTATRVTKRPRQLAKQLLGYARRVPSWLKVAGIIRLLDEIFS